MTSTVIAAEADPECHPLGPNNKLVFSPGLLSGTPASNSGRNSCGAKSPLTGGIKKNMSSSKQKSIHWIVTLKTTRIYHQETLL
jgi:hypothetical protein